MKLRNCLGKILNIFTKVWYGYEITGLENIPDTGPVLLVFYHAAFPADLMFFMSRIYFDKRFVWTVVDRFFTKVPNSKTMSDFGQLIFGDYSICENNLKDGEIVLLAPGGVYEACCDDNYSVLWQNRIGFAKLVHKKFDYKVIPVFTKNVREAWISITVFRKFWESIYLKTRMPSTLVVGGLPVKLTAVVGAPISVAQCETPEEVKSQIQTAMENLITNNQKKPGSTWNALIDRFR